MEIQYNQPEQTFAGAWVVALSLLGLALWTTFGHGQKPALTIGLALLFLGVGLVLIVTRSDQHASISENGPVTITNTRKFGGKATTRTIERADITSVQYYPFVTEYFDRGSSVYLILKDGTKVKLNSQRLFHIWFSNKPAGPLENQAREVAEFIRLPLSLPEPGKFEPLDR